MWVAERCLRIRAGKETFTVSIWAMKDIDIGISCLLTNQDKVCSNCLGNLDGAYSGRPAAPLDDLQNAQISGDPQMGGASGLPLFSVSTESILVLSKGTLTSAQPNR